MTIATTRTPHITDQMRVWIGCFACYNDDLLVGEWHSAFEARDVTTKQLHASSGIVTDDAGYVRGQEGYGPHEELWCFDVSDPSGVLTGEMSPEQASHLVEVVQECVDVLLDCPEDAFFAYWRNQGGDLDTDLALSAEDQYVGDYSSFRDYADECAERDIEELASRVQPGGFDQWSQRAHRAARVEAHEWISRHFDWDAYSRDLEQAYTVLDHAGGVWIFDDAR